MKILLPTRNPCRGRHPRRGPASGRHEGIKDDHHHSKGDDAPIALVANIRPVGDSFKLVSELIEKP